MNSKEVKERIEYCLPDCKCFVTEFSGGDDHYSVVVVSDKFLAQSRLRRHRMVMEMFKNEVDSGEVHALSIQAFTPEEWKKTHQ